jgi:hypothetical protein
MAASAATPMTIAPGSFGHERRPRARLLAREAKVGEALVSKGTPWSWSAAPSRAAWLLVLSFLR